MSFVLVVDDVRVNRLMIAKGLAPIPIVEAEDAAQALELFFTKHPAVVLLDIGLPEVDGVTLLRIIRQHDRRTGGHTPVVVVSGAGTRQHVVETARVGVEGFFVKPLEPTELAQRVRELWPKSGGEGCGEQEEEKKEPTGDDGAEA
ncbi:response regulator [Deferrisoma camini]|uniref:response regulator n=1 Tax=Deferrisoma camini TaxID=1035120 RepID=UPI00046D0EDB|nr:response regulator [Deferrisoma camini]